jgi:hypothetical protein
MTSRTSQDLVPTGQPHGDRQRNVAAMELANVPTSSEGAAAPPVGGGGSFPPGPLPGGGPGLPTAAPPDLAGFDVFAGRDPTATAPGVVPQQQASRFRAGAATTTNQVMRDTLRYVDRYMEG